MSPSRSIVVLTLSGALAATPLPTQEPELLAQEGAVILPIESESRLVVEGFRGAVELRAGNDEELRYRAGVPGGRDDVPVELWKDGSTLRLLPAAGREDEPVDFEIAVPPPLSTALRMQGGKIRAVALHGALDIEGQDAEVYVRSIDGSASVELRGGTLELIDARADVTVSAADADVKVAGVQEALFLTARGGSVRLQGIGSETELDLDGTELVLDGLQGPLRLRAYGGSARLAGLEAGGDLRLSETALRLERCKGDLMIETDGDVSFFDLEASLRVNGYGANVTGKGNAGLLEAKTSGAAIRIEDIRGPVRVQGDGLETDMRLIGGEVYVETSSSAIRIESAAATVTVRNEFGDVEVAKSSGALDIRSRDGSVLVTDAASAVQVDADGPEVVVSWASMNMKEDSVIVNESGDVRVHLPKSGGCFVDARSEFGGVESALPSVQVSDDGSQARGVVNRRNRPRLRINSGGRVEILAGARREEPSER